MAHPRSAETKRATATSAGQAWHFNALGVSDGRTIVVDGALDMLSRSFSGKIFD